MADTRFTTGRRIRTTGLPVGVHLNLFGFAKLEAGVTAPALSAILMDAGQVALVDAISNWPVDTGASQSTIKLLPVSSTDSLRSHHAGGDPSRSARVVLQVGGPELIAHKDNPKHIDYALYIEFNGSPAGRGQFTILNAILGNEVEMKAQIKAGVGSLIRSLLI